MRGRARPKSAPRSRRSFSQPGRSSSSSSNKQHVVRLPTAQRMKSNRPASAQAGKRGRAARHRPRSAGPRKVLNGDLGPSPCSSLNEEKKILVALEKVVVGLVQENRLVEAVTLATKLTSTVKGESGVESKLYKHCATLTLKLSIELGERQEERGEDSDVSMALEFLDNARDLLEEQKFDDDADWENECLGFKTSLLAVIASCHRRLGRTKEAEEAAVAALDISRQRQHLQQGKALPAAREAEARCYLILCTIVSGNGDHVRALKYAKLAATILESISSKNRLRIKNRLERAIAKSLGISYYNIGAEMEHVHASGQSMLVESGDEGNNRIDLDPGVWYKKALFMARKLPNVFSKDVIDTFAATAQACAESRQRPTATPTTPERKRGKKKAVRVKAGNNSKTPLEENVGKLLQGLKLSGRTFADLRSELSGIAAKNMREVENGQYIRLSRSDFVKTIRKFCDLKSADAIASRCCNGGNGGVIKIEEFERISQEAPIRVLQRIVKGSETSAITALGRYDARQLSYVQIIQALDRIGRKPTKHQASMLLETLQVNDTSTLSFPDLYDVLSRGSEDVVDEKVAGPSNPFNSKPDVDGIDWETFDENTYCTEAKLDYLDSFDVSQIASKSVPTLREADSLAKQKLTSSGRPRKLAQLPHKKAVSASNLSSKRSVLLRKTSGRSNMTLQKDRIVRLRKNREALKGLAFSPVPITIAGWRTLESEIVENRNCVSEDGKVIKWPPMVRANELNALLVPGAKRRVTTVKPVNLKGRKMEKDPFSDDGEVDRMKDEMSSWSKQLRSLKEQIRLK